MVFLLRIPFLDRKKLGLQYLAYSFVSLGRSLTAETKFEIKTMEINRLISAKMKLIRDISSLVP